MWISIRTGRIKRSTSFTVIVSEAQAIRNRIKHPYFKLFDDFSNCLTAAFSNPCSSRFKPHGFKHIDRWKAQFSKGSQLSNHVFQLDVWSSTVGLPAMIAATASRSAYPMR
jgi:hypothetical protein